MEKIVSYQEAYCYMELLYQFLHIRAVVGTENLQGHPLSVCR